MKDKWIADAAGKNKGKLRAKLHAKEGKPIPEAKLEKATHSKSPKLRKEATLAENLKGMRKKK